MTIKEVYFTDINGFKSAFSHCSKAIAYINKMREKGYLGKKEKVKIEAIVLDYEYMRDTVIILEPVQDNEINVSLEPIKEIK